MFVHLNFNKCILFSGQIIPVFLKFSIVYFFTVLTHNTSNDYFRSLQMNNTKKFVNLLKDIFSYTENEEYNFSLPKYKKLNRLNIMIFFLLLV